MTHNYRRHGTLDLFAAMNVPAGGALHQTAGATPASTSWPFFKWFDLHVHRDDDVHVVITTGDSIRLTQATRGKGVRPLTN